MCSAVVSGPTETLVICARQRQQTQQTRPQELWYAKESKKKQKKTTIKHLIVNSRSAAIKVIKHSQLHSMIAAHLGLQPKARAELAEVGHDAEVRAALGRRRVAVQQQDSHGVRSQPADIGLQGYVGLSQGTRRADRDARKGCEKAQ